MTIIRSALLALLWLLPNTATTQVNDDPGPGPSPNLGAGAKEPWETYDEFIKKRNAVTALGPDLFGDQVSLRDGSLTFSVTDISVPGNSALPVALTRTFAVQNRSTGAPHEGLLGDWDLDIPRLEATYAQQSTKTPNWPADRCSNTNPPPLVVSGGGGYQAEEYWSGIQASMPGGGELMVANAGAPKPSGNPSAQIWMTSGFTYFSCIVDDEKGPAIINGGGGQGFLALTADGTKYKFRHMAKYWEAPLSRPLNYQTNAALLNRERYVLYVTEIVDRFNNVVSFNYANEWNEPLRLVSITSNDALVGGQQRSIQFTYNNQGKIATATSGGRTWRYEYNTSNPTRLSLTTVILPDDKFPTKPSRWTYNFAALSSAEIAYSVKGRRCGQTAAFDGRPLITGTVTHPAGAIGEFTVQAEHHARNLVPKQCILFQLPVGDLQNYASVHARVHDAFSITSKVIRGPGIQNGTWTWTYGGIQSLNAAPEEPGFDVFGLGSFALPGFQCTDDSCAGATVTTTTSPGGEWARYTFGNTYRYDEGKLRKVERGSSASNILETTVTTHEFTQSGQNFATPIASSQRIRGDGFSSEYLRPEKVNVISRDGATFTRTVTQFDAYARPVIAQHASNMNAGDPQPNPPEFSKTETTGYFDNTALWVLGQVASVSVFDGSTTRTPQQTTFNAMALPENRLEFGRFVSRRTYNSFGLVEDIFDASNVKRTRLSNYVRGMPQNVLYHDSSTESAIVNTHGEITSLTDANGFTTTYGYDAMGRINLITYPAGDSVAWTPTSITFEPVNTTEYGLPAGHWRRTVSTGNQHSVTYYDGQWRPVLSREYDAANEAGTRRMVRRAFDYEGRETFVSYPQRSIAAYNSAVDGTASVYDSLNRPTLTQANSELGVLSTSYQYLSGFRTQVTNPRGKSTITAYQAYSQPTTDFPTRIDSPLNVVTLVSRDVYGKPTAMTRNAVHDGLPITLTRRWVYEPDYQRLCKTIEPEGGAEIVDYDTSGNLAWKAPGQPYTSASSCDRTAVGASAKISETYDLRNRPLVTSFGDGSPAISRTWHPDGLPNTVSSSISTWTYQYNKRRLPTTETLALAGISLNGSLATPLVVNYYYNPLGHLSSWDYPGSGTLTLNPNALGEATSAGPYASGMTYHPNGMLATMSYGNGSVRSVSLNARQLPHTVNDSNVMTDVYNYDQNGNILGVSDTFSGDNFPTGRLFTYDDRDRLQTVTYERLQAGNHPVTGQPLYHNNVQISHAYDGLDNHRTYRTTPGPWRQMNYEYDAATWRLNRIWSPTDGVNFITYGYDTRGNATSRGIWGSQTFDLGNRMRSMSGSGVSATYDYDGHGRRTLIAEPGTPRRIQFYHQGGLLLAEIAIDGVSTVTELKSYFFQGRNGIAERKRTAGSDVTNYVHSDHLGSPQVRSSAFGSVYERTMYEPYGLKVNSAPNSPYGIGLFPDGLGFAGHRVDRVSGLSYMQQRYYDPVAGRFISMDPVTADSDKLFNRYAYANNNPISLVDPDGRAAQIAAPILRRLIAQAIGAKQRESPPIILNIPNSSGQLVPTAFSFKNGRIDHESGTVVLNEENSTSSEGASTEAEPTSPHIDPTEVAGKTPKEIDAVAKEKGLTAKGPDPQSGRGAYIDPATGEQRILIHPDADCGPHCHVNDPNGQRLDIDGNKVAPESPAAHLPLKKD